MLYKLPYLAGWDVRKQNDSSTRCVVSASNLNCISLKLTSLLSFPQNKLKRDNHVLLVTHTKNTVLETEKNCLKCNLIKSEVNDLF